jgi:vacuolar-type H+-ATPase subunit H
MKKIKKIQTATTSKQNKIDIDAFWKHLLTEFLEEAVALMHPKLYEVVDWTVPPVFLEQELINALKGRFKIKDKRKFTDKLAKLHLKSGEDYYIILHAEAQHEPEEGFNKRMYIYRCLIYLWSDIDEITALAIFTGAPPDANSLEYNHECLGTEILYRYKFYIAVEQNEQELLESDNPFAIAILAAMYTYQTINDAERRFAFKRKVFELAQKKNISIDKMSKLLTFVKDFMYLPEALEREFEEESFSNFLKSSQNMNDRMVYREGTIKFFDKFLYEITGKTIDEYRAEAAAIDARNKAFNEVNRKIKQAETLLKRTETLKKQAEKKIEAANEKIEAERNKAEAERIKAETERIKAEAERIKAEADTIFNFYAKAGLSMETIATTMNLELEYVQKIIDARLKNQ